MIKPLEESTVDVVIVGAGPAGCAAAIWCADVGLSSVVLEADAETGGQLRRIHAPIRNYPGIKSISGKNLRDNLRQHVEAVGGRFEAGTQVVGIDTTAMAVLLADGRRCVGRAIIVATGVRRRRLGLSGEIEFAGKGILESGAKQAADVIGKRVAIAGGGDAAVENALILSETAATVTVIHRTGHFSARQHFMDAVRTRGNVTLLENSTVAEICGDEIVRSIRVAGDHAGQLDIDALLVRIGVEPNSEAFADVLEIDRRGYIVVDKHGATRRKGIYAVGDVASDAPTIASAVGQAASAVKDIVARLDA